MKISFPLCNVQKQQMQSQYLLGDETKCQRENKNALNEKLFIYLLFLHDASSTMALTGYRVTWNHAKI